MASATSRRSLNSFQAAILGRIRYLPPAQSMPAAVYRQGRQIVSEAG